MNEESCLSTREDEKVFKILEQAVDRALNALEHTKEFQAFLMLLNDAREIELF